MRKEVRLTTTIESHTTCSGEVLVCKTPFFNALLGQGVSGCKKDLCMKVVSCNGG